MTRRDFEKDRSRRRARSHGTEAAGDTPSEAEIAELIGGSPQRPLNPPQKRAPRSKRALQRQIDKAMKTATHVDRVVKCQCGHRGVAKVPIAKLNAPLKFSKCGRRQ